MIASSSVNDKVRAKSRHPANEWVEGNPRELGKTKRRELENRILTQSKRAAKYDRLALHAGSAKKWKEFTHAADWYRRQAAIAARELSRATRPAPSVAKSRTPSVTKPPELTVTKMPAPSVPELSAVKPPEPSAAKTMVVLRFLNRSIEGANFESLPPEVEFVSYLVSTEHEPGDEGKEGFVQELGKRFRPFIEFLRPIARKLNVTASLVDSTGVPLKGWEIDIAQGDDGFVRAVCIKPLPYLGKVMLTIPTRDQLVKRFLEAVDDVLGITESKSDLVERQIVYDLQPLSATPICLVLAGETGEQELEVESVSSAQGDSEWRGNGGSATEPPNYLT